MKTNLTVANCRVELTDIVQRVKEKDERFVLTKHGQEIAAIISVEDLNFFESLEEAINQSSIEANNEEHLKEEAINLKTDGNKGKSTRKISRLLKRFCGG